MASWFTEGTVTVTNGNAVVAGIGTKFSNCRSGDMFVGPDGGIYQIVNPSSDLAVSISPAYRGPTIAGAAYGIVPVNGYPKALADAVNLMVQQWGATLAGLGTVSTENVVPVSKGGTGGTTQATARTGLGLGSAATLNAGLASGNVLPFGAYGIGGRAPDIPGNSFNAIGDTGIYRSSGGTANSPANYGYGTLFVENYDAGFTAQHATSFSGRLFFRINNNFSWGSWGEIYTTMNTTRGSGGALSAASPIVRIANVAASERRDLLEQTFQSAGAWGVANEDARGVLVERLSIGEYRVTGSLGLALEGWRTHDPSSPDGGRMLGITDSQQDDSGNVIIRLFKQRWTLTDDGEMVPGRGAPIDVPLNSWIDVRLEMPKTQMPPPAASAQDSQADADAEASSIGETHADQ